MENFKLPKGAHIVQEDTQEDITDPSKLKLPAGARLVSIEDEMEQDKKQSYFLSLFDEVLLTTPKTLLAGMLKGVAGTADMLDFYATKISELTGMEKGGLSRWLSDDWRLWSDYFAERGLPLGLQQKIVSGAGEGLWNIGMLMTLGKGLGPARAGALPMYGAAEGGKEGGILGAATGAVGGALTHGVFKGLQVLPRGARVATAFGTGATVTPGDIEEKAAGGIFWAGMTFPGKGVKARELVPEKVAYKAEGIYQRTISRFQSIENLPTRAKALGLNIKPGEDVGLLIKSYLGKLGKVKSVLEDKTYIITKDGKFKITGEGLKPILDRYDKFSPEKSRKVREQDLDDFLKAQRYLYDLQRAKPGREGKEKLDEWDIIATPKQTKWASETLNKFNKKYGTNIDILKKTGDDLYGFQKRVLKLLVSSERMDQKTYNTIVEKNPHYIPLDRIITEQGEIVGSTVMSGGKLLRTPSPVKRIRGSEKEAYPALESVIKNTYRIMDIAERNNIALQISKYARFFPKDISPVRSSYTKVKLSGEELRKLESPLTKGEKGTEVFRALPFASGERIVDYYDSGKLRHMKVSKNLYDAMSGLNETSLHMLAKLLSVPARTLRTGATITPEFMTRNFIRDTLVTTIQTRLGFKPFVDPARALADIIGKTDMYYDWLRSGGAISGFVETNRTTLKKVLKELQTNKNKFRYLNIINDAGAISQAIEQSTRVAVYKRAIRKGYSPLEAVKFSREASVDFGRRGSGMQDINATIAFFNAGLQGMDKTTRIGIQDPIGMTIKGLSLVTIPSVISYILNKDDPEYKEIPRWQKDLFWLFKVGKIYVRIPKPFLYGQIFGSSAERFLEYADSQDPEALEGLTTTLIDAALPTQGDPAGALIPTGVKGLIENVTPRGWSLFKQREIVPAGREKMIGAEQHGKYTTETAKLAGGLIDYSPAKIENFITSFTGGTGWYALKSIDEVLKLSGAVEEKGTRPSELADIPLIKGFVARDPISQPESLNKFYERADKLFKQHNTYGHYIKEGEFDKADKFLRKNQNLLYSPLAEHYRRSIAEATRNIDMITKSKELSKDEKRKMLKEFETYRLVIAISINAMLKELEGN